MMAVVVLVKEMLTWQVEVTEVEDQTIVEMVSRDLLKNVMMETIQTVTAVIAIAVMRFQIKKNQHQVVV